MRVGALVQLREQDARGQRGGDPASATPVAAPAVRRHPLQPRAVEPGAGERLGQPPALHPSLVELGGQRVLAVGCARSTILVAAGRGLLHRLALERGQPAACSRSTPLATKWLDGVLAASSRLAEAPTPCAGRGGGVVQLVRQPGGQRPSAASFSLLARGASAPCAPADRARGSAHAPAARAMNSRKRSALQRSTPHRARSRGRWRHGSPVRRACAGVGRRLAAARQQHLSPSTPRVHSSAPSA